MPLETLEQGVNIRELTLKAPEKPKEYLFDPYKDISEKKWEELLTNLRSWRTVAETFVTQWNEWAWRALELKILRPDKIADLNLDEEAEKQMIDLADKFRNQANASGPIDAPDTTQLFNMTVARGLFPESPKIKDSMTESIWQRYYDYAPKCGYGAMLEILSCLKLSSPKNASKLRITPKQLKAMEANLVVDIVTYTNLPKYRILFPDTNIQQILGPTKLLEYKKLALRDREIASGYYYLAIISADKVVVDDTGLHLEFNHEKKTPMEDITPPPASLKF